ncbi:MAG TPA: non-canonical purine NTP pyrophosphatase, partial [Gammaproteobacteria bacterium]|nr:non-canonical purine NTP pyrophosphatase [Gammaproteobacteria bacterium]
MTERWVIATGNPGKLAELRILLAAAHLGALELVAQTDLGVPPADETALTFLENALAKARHAARHTGLPAIADDSGLAVAALGGAPGVRSARFAGPAADDGANVAKLLDALAGVPRGRRAARFH